MCNMVCTTFDNFAIAEYVHRQETDMQLLEVEAVERAAGDGSLGHEDYLNIVLANRLA